MIQDKYIIGHKIHLGSGFDVMASFMKERALSCQLYDHESYKHERIQLPEEIKIFAVVNNACSQTSQMINRYEAAKKKYKDFFFQSCSKDEKRARSLA